MIKITQKAILYLLIVFLGLMMALPFLWMFATSFKPYEEIFVQPVRLLAENPVFSNYKQVFEISEYVNFLRGFVNTLIVTVPTALVGVLFSSLAAFAFSRMKFPGRNVIFLAYIATMAIPLVVTIVPTYVLFTKLRLLDSFLALMLPGMFGSAGAVFFTRQYMRGIPIELDEAARVDGMGWFGIFLNIDFPLSKPIVVTNLLFAFIGGYNDYMGPLLYIRSSEKYTLQLALSAMNDTFGTRWGVVMAGACIALIPTALIFLLAQKYFIEGVSVSSGLKG